MSTLPRLEKYRVREVECDGYKLPIVLHARGGSSLLVALANAVLRQYDVRKAFVTEGGFRGRPKYVRTEVLFQIVEMAIVGNLQVLLKHKKIDACTMMAAWRGCRYFIRLLHTDYVLDPIFTSCTAFVESDFNTLFDSLGFQVCHGLVIDPEKDPDTANAFGSKSHNDIFEILVSPPAEVDENTVLLMKNFKANIQGRLTSYGLTCLKKTIGTFDVGILLRDGHFSMLRKIDGVLVTLQATEEQFKENPDAVWQSLEEANDDGILLSSKSEHVKKQPVVTDAEKEVAMKRQEAIIQDEAQQNVKLSKPSKKQRYRAAKRGAGKSQFDVQPEVAACDNKTEQLLKGSKPLAGEPDKHKQQEQEVEPEITEEERDNKTEQLLKGSKPLAGEPDKHKQQEQEVEPERTEEERDDIMCESFKRFLREFEEEGTTKPYYKGQVKALDYCESFKLTIKFKDLESHDRETARYICNNMPRVSEKLTSCVSNFLLEHEEFKKKSDEVVQKTKIEFSDIPAPNSVQDFTKFAKENDMHKL
ncbi:unnamed protein product [Urochloa decumbens]|uniref:Uncharacterized protein n=1 Tax=Urochloa decumbens TaxID=240449 RepID=A0ABC9DE40_9POAL